MISFEGEIYDLSQSGLGVVNDPEGCVYFVQGAWPGDVGTFEVLSKKKRYGFAKLLNLKTRSAFRLSESPCAFHGSEDGSCGGCPWIPFEYEDQLRRKEALVHNALKRGKALEKTEHILPIIASEKSLGYRNRAQFKTDGVKLGFVSFQNKTLVDVSHCVALNDECSNRLADLRTQMPNQAWAPKGQFLWNFIDINDSSPWNPKKIAVNHRLPFMQGNHAQNANMKHWLSRQLSLLGQTEYVMELFCGSGNFTQVIADAKNTKSIFAIEMSEVAIDELKKKQIPKTQAFACNLYKPGATNRIKSQRPQKPTTLILDPPREGFESITAFVQAFPSLKNALYISCSLNTFVRDTAHLLDLGFRIVELQPIDMFPNTPHIEICARFVRA